MYPNLLRELEEGPCANMELRYLNYFDFLFLPYLHINLFIMPKATPLKRTTGITSRSTPPARLSTVKRPHTLSSTSYSEPL
jgi:hypothetical protein